MDGQYEPVRTQVDYLFECRTFSVLLRYEQHDRFLFAVTSGEVQIANARQARLIALRHNGRAFVYEEAALGAELVAWFVRVEQITATCYRDEVTIDVRGIPRHAWVDLVQRRRQLPPPRELASMRVSAQGVTWSSLAEDRLPGRD